MRDFREAMFGGDTLSFTATLYRGGDLVDVTGAAATFELLNAEEEVVLSATIGDGLVLGSEPAEGKILGFIQTGSAGLQAGTTYTARMRVTETSGRVSTVAYGQIEVR